MATEAYPQRESHFAHRLVRLMLRTCAAQEIGSDGFLLVTAVVHCEDSKRYTAAVTYWNEQLMTTLGFGSKGKLDRARRRAVEHGWLHYEPGGKGRVGKYWGTMPERFEDLPGTPIDDGEAPFQALSSPPVDRQTAFLSTSGPTNGRQTGDKRETNGRQTGENRTTTGPLSCLPLNPNPGPGPKKIPPKTEAAFAEWWEHYPKKSGKDDARRRWGEAVKRIAAEEGSTPTEAREALLNSVKIFARSDKAKGRWCWHPATWLHQGHYNDDPETWKEKTDGKPTGPGQRHPLDAAADTF